MDDEDDGSAVDATTTDEDSSERGMGPWDSTLQPSDSDDESSDESDGEDDGWGNSREDRTVGDEGRTGDDEGDEDDEDDEDGEGNVAGALAPEVPVEPGRPDPVNVLFVVLGAYLGVVAIASLVGAGGSFTIIEYVAVTVGFFALSGLVYGFLARGNPDT